MISKLLLGWYNDALRKRLEKNDEQLKNVLPPINNDKQARDDYEKRINALNAEKAEIIQQLKNKRAEYLDRQQQELSDFAKKNIGTVAGRAAAL